MKTRQKNGTQTRHALDDKIQQSEYLMCTPKLYPCKHIAASCRRANLNYPQNKNWAHTRVSVGRLHTRIIRIFAFNWQPQCAQTLAHGP